MQTKVRFILVLACLLATSCGNSVNAPQIAVVASETPTFLPTPTKTFTPTNTPPPTETITPTPTETPGPMWQLGNFGEFPHAVNDNGQEVFNFLTEFDNMPSITDINPSTIEAIQSAYENIILSDGTPLVKSMNGPEYQDLPPLNWTIHGTPYGDTLFIGNDNTAQSAFPRTRYLGMVTFNFSGNEQNPFSEQFVLITMQVEDKSQQKGYSLWTGLFPRSKVTGMLSGRIQALFNNNSQLSPYVNFDADANDSQYNDLVIFLQTESEFDGMLYEQALRDFEAGKLNDYFRSHLMLTNIGATRWHPPKAP